MRVVSMLFMPGCLHRRMLSKACCLICKGGCKAEYAALESHLRQQKLQAGICKEADGGCIPLKVSACKALVGRVEEGQQALLLHNPQNAAPLLRRRIHTCGVVCACVLIASIQSLRKPEDLREDKKA